jgi:cytoskeletal protein RodZ
MQGGTRPIRLAGFVLIGVAVVAVGLGVFALTGNGASPQAQGRPPVTSTTTPPTKPPTTTPKPTTTEPFTSTSAFPTGQTTTVVPPPAKTTAPSLKQTVQVRVYNNSMIKDLAMTGAQEFRDAGYNVVQTGNYSQGIIPHSTAYYSPAAGEQQVATELAHDFGMKVMPRFSGIAFASPGVIVILTEDFTAGKK